MSVASIQLTGRIRVAGPLGTLEAAELPGRQARLVLASLALTDHPVPLDVLAHRPRARPGEGLLTRTVTDLVAGHAGVHRFSTVDSEWELAAARS